MSDYDFAPVDQEVLFGTNWERKEANEARAAKTGRVTCSACGRGLVDGSGYMVVVIHGGESVLHPSNWDDDLPMRDPGYMGMWDLGPECAKGIPRNYRVKRS